MPPPPPTNSSQSIPKLAPREDEQSIKARGSQLYQDKRPEAEPEPLPLEQRRRRKPFKDYLAETPSAPMPPTTKLMLYAAGAVVLLLLIASLTSHKPAEPGEPEHGSASALAPTPAPAAAPVGPGTSAELGGVMAGIVTWFKADAIAGAADGGPICAWNDSSGRNNNASQGNPGACPTYAAGAFNGLPGLRFDANRKTQLTFGRPVQDDFTILAVFRSDHGSGPGKGWWDSAGLVDGEVQGDTNDFGMSLSAEGRVIAGTGKPDTHARSNPGLADNRPHLAAFTRARGSGQVTLQIDGVTPQRGRVKGGTQPLNAAARLALGSLQTGANSYAGEIAEVVLYDRALSDADLRAVADALMAKYKIGR